MIDKSDLHDFLNNGMRIEILTKLISEAIEVDKQPEWKQIEDLADSLEKHSHLLSLLKPL